MKITNPAGLSFNFLDNGSVRSIEAGPVRINLKEGTPFSKPGTNIYLRKRTEPVEFTPLLGPESNSRFSIHGDVFVAKGSWSGFEFTCSLHVSGKSLSWQWQVDIINTSGESIDLDLIYVQDIALKPANSGVINEYYVSQYLERRILEDKLYGSVLCCRQNMKEPTGHPWLMMACKNGAASASTDGMQFYGKTFRETGIPEGLLAGSPGGECAGESSVLTLQEKPFTLAPGEAHRGVLIATYLADHPGATTLHDLNMLPDLMAEFEHGSPSVGAGVFTSPATNLFNGAPFLPVEDLDEAELTRFFGEQRRHSEEEDGRLLSFFSAQDNHVVMRAKEVMTDRPHGHIMQAQAGLIPDENIVSTTAFAFGVFNSHLTQGNTNFNVLLSIATSPFNQAPETGQRIFVETDGRPYLLGVPSAFEIGLNHCRWIYKSGRRIFQVRSWTSKNAPQVNTDFSVIRGGEVRLLISHHFDDAGSWTSRSGNIAGEYLFKPGPGSMIAGKFPQAQFRMIVQASDGPHSNRGDEALYSDAQNHGSSLFVLDFPAISRCCVSIAGEVCRPAAAVAFEDAENQWFSDTRMAWNEWKQLSVNLVLNGEQEDIAAIREILPWFGMNAMTHYLTPYGLEQFGGAAWGTRDVSQGPVDLLLAMEKYAEARKVLTIIFSNQNPDGGWPQWWMFDSYHNIRADEAHGDIFYWCIIALANYIKVTGDLEVLDEILPYYHEKGPEHAEKTALSEHIDRLVDMITGSFIPGTALVPFGGGDWNDSLQPVSRDLAERLVSSWTVEMNFQAFHHYSQVYEKAGRTDKAQDLKNICERIRSDFNKYLVKDGIVAGYGLVEDDNSISVLLHPEDDKTGIRYSILPMERGILSEIFTREQAISHQELIEQHLKGPDGARLMDRPLKYKGGVQEIFQRAESSTFFGREIGLMYVHEHIRYAESLARTGRAEAFVKALRQAIPVGYRDVVPCGDLRQSNCYYSSSDVYFKNRYAADERYDEIKTGNILLKGGWRVYSSGPGIYISLIITRLIGLRLECGNVVIDPVVPLAMDGLSVSIHFSGYPLTIIYSVKENCFGPGSVSVNGNTLAFTREENKYRRGGAVIPLEQFVAQLNRQENTVTVYM